MEKEKLTKKSPCCGKGLRAYVNESVDVYIDPETGFLESGFNFLNDGVDRASVFCEECGENVAV